MYVSPTLLVSLRLPVPSLGKNNRVLRFITSVNVIVPSCLPSVHPRALGRVSIELPGGRVPGRTSFSFRCPGPDFRQSRRSRCLLFLGKMSPSPSVLVCRRSPSDLQCSITEKSRRSCRESRGRPSPEPCRVTPPVGVRPACRLVAPTTLS